MGLYSSGPSTKYAELRQFGKSSKVFFLFIFYATPDKIHLQTENLYVQRTSS